MPPEMTEKDAQARAAPGAKSRSKAAGQTTPSVACQFCPLRMNGAFRPLSACELESVAAMKSDHLAFAPGEELVSQGQAGGAFYTLFEGWAARCRTLADGSRQILDVLLPGDLIGLPQVLLSRRAHAVRALTAVTVCALDATRIETLVERHGSLALGLLAARVEDMERADARLTLLGRMGAEQRIGYLLLDLRDRLARRGLIRGQSCLLPLRRAELADAVGLSKVHVMRALRALRTQGLIELRHRTLTIPSESKLARFSGYSYPGSGMRCAIL